MPRSVGEWIGKNDDQAIPTMVQVRILNRQRPGPDELPICPECGLPMREGEGKPEFDHLIPLEQHGRHAEGNIRAIHRRCHTAKTAREAGERSDHRQHVARGYSIRKPKGRPMAGTRASGIRKRLSGQVERWDE